MNDGLPQASGQLLLLFETIRKVISVKILIVNLKWLNETFAFKEAILMTKITCVILGLAFLSIGVLGITDLVPMFASDPVYLNIVQIILGGLGLLVGIYSRQGQKYDQQTKDYSQQTKANADHQRQENESLRSENVQARQDETNRQLQENEQLKYQIEQQKQENEQLRSKSQ